MCSQKGTMAGMKINIGNKNIKNSYQNCLSCGIIQSSFFGGVLE